MRVRPITSPSTGSGRCMAMRCSPCTTRKASMPVLRIGQPEAGMGEHHGLRRHGAQGAVGVDEIELARIERILPEADGERIEHRVARGQALPDLRDLVGHQGIVGEGHVQSAACVPRMAVACEASVPPLPWQSAISAST